MSAIEPEKKVDDSNVLCRFENQIIGALLGKSMIHVCDLYVSCHPTLYAHTKKFFWTGINLQSSELGGT